MQSIKRRVQQLGWIGTTQVAFMEIVLFLQVAGTDTVSILHVLIGSILNASQVHSVLLAIHLVISI